MYFTYNCILSSSTTKVEFESEIGIEPDTQAGYQPGDTAFDPGAPADPSTLKPGMIIDGYRFEGWFLDPERTIPYDFSTPLTKDMVLYAKWTKVGNTPAPVVPGSGASAVTGRSPKTGETTSPVAMLLLIGMADVGFAYTSRKTVR